MKRILIYLFLLLSLSLNAFAQERSQNFILTRTMLDGYPSGRYLDEIQYYDGLGRSFMTVQKGITPSKCNLMTLQEYDNIGRLSYKWLAHVTSADYLSDAAFSKGIKITYDGENEPYDELNYDPCPLDRVRAVIGAGEHFHDLNLTNYLFNTSSGDLCCKLYQVSSSGEVILDGNYGVGELSVLENKDENNNKSYTFTDKENKKILIREMLENAAYDTYYVYDTFGNLIFVLPPAYQDESDLNLYAYQYKYDSRNNCIEKKLPGCDPIKYVYDSADNKILSQDGEQRLQEKWTFYLYDSFHRLTLKGTCNCDNPSLIEKQYVTCTLDKDNSGMIIPCGMGLSGYTSSFTFASPTIHEINYYDDYSFLSLKGYLDKSQFEIGTTSAVGYQTGHVITLLDTNTFLYSAIYYDIKGRPVKKVSDNHLGGYDNESISYSFAGKPVTKLLTHIVPSKVTQKETYSYSYDHADRLLKITHKLNENAIVTLLENTYDELGRLSSKKHHGNDVLKSDYAYNIRNWITNISGPKFTECLYYNELLDGIGTFCYNGNINALSWRAGEETLIRKYHFTYDGLDRLTNAQYRQSDDRNDIYNVGYQYNKMGSIVHLARTGLSALPSSYDCIDNLTIAYDGNQLRRVDDKSSQNPLYNGAFNFVDGTSSDKEYNYDKNGNLTQDLNKQISKIEYNSLNLPSHIEFGMLDKHIKYLYGADGVKRCVQHYVAPSLVVTPLPDVDLEDSIRVPLPDLGGDSPILRPGVFRSVISRPDLTVDEPSSSPMYDLFTTI